MTLLANPAWLGPSKVIVVVALKTVVYTESETLLASTKDIAGQSLPGDVRCCLVPTCNTFLMQISSSISTTDHSVCLIFTVRDRHGLRTVQQSLYDRLQTQNLKLLKHFLQLSRTFPCKGLSVITLSVSLSDTGVTSQTGGGRASYKNPHKLRPQRRSKKSRKLFKITVQEMKAFSCGFNSQPNSHEPKGGR